MADRRSLFSRFWPASAPRRPPAAQTTAPPPTVTTTTTTDSPPIAETQTPARQSTTVAGSPPTGSSEPRKSPPSQVQTAGQPTTATSTKPLDEPKSSSPSRATTPSPSSSKPASPSRLLAQSGSPPQPPSASHAARRAPRMDSQTTSTPKKAPQPLSPSRPTSRSPKQASSSSPKGAQPASPSKESRQPIQENSSSLEAPVSASNGEDSKPAASQEEPQLKAEVKSDGANDFNGRTLDGTSFKHDEVELTLSHSSEDGTTTTSVQGPEAPAPSKNLESSAINGEHKPLVELNAKPDEAEDVKEVQQAANTEANEETKREAINSLAPKPGSEAEIIEKAEIPSKPDQMQREKQEAVDAKEILATSVTSVPPADTTSPQKKSSTFSGTNNKSALPNGEHVPLHKSIRADMPTLVNQVAVGDPKSAVYDTPVSVITLAGDNRGASMRMESDSSEREGPVHIHRSYKINPDESDEATTDSEGNSEQKRSADADSTDDQPREAYVNNNAQGINNSIVFNCSVTEGNPGVHMIVTHLPKEPTHSTEKTSPSETRKAEFNTTRAEKRTYQPTVRRRCLRGLLLETSESDPENAEKPRRHGCRVGRQKRDKGNNIDVL